MGNLTGKGKQKVQVGIIHTQIQYQNQQLGEEESTMAGNGNYILN